jgi:hypothetical protein
MKISELATEMLRAVEEDGSLRLNAAFGDAVGSDEREDIDTNRQVFIDTLRELQKVPE